MSICAFVCVVYVPGAGRVGDDGVHVSIRMGGRWGKGECLLFLVSIAGCALNAEFTTLCTFFYVFKIRDVYFVSGVYVCRI